MSINTTVIFQSSRVIITIINNYVIFKGYTASGNEYMTTRRATYR